MKSNCNCDIWDPPITYRLSPYKERCEKLRLEKLSTRRKVTNALMACDLFNKTIVDADIEKRFVRSRHHHLMRNQMPLAETMQAIKSITNH